MFAQEVWGYSALRTGLSFLPLTVALVAASIVASALVQRVGARPLLLIGSVAAAGGMYWLSRITEHGSYAGGLLGPSLVVGVGLGLLFVPLPLVSMAGVAESVATFRRWASANRGRQGRRGWPGGRIQPCHMPSS